MTRFTSILSLLALLLLANTGCWSKVSNWKFSNMFDLDKGMPWEDDEELREGTPVRIVSSWVDTVKHTQGEMPERGFGGRLLFYDEESNDPIKVEGELVVYAFDESNRDPIDNRPTRRFVFPSEQLSLHMSKSPIGPSYSFFLPWDQVGGPQAEISLICRFKPAKGAIVVSEQTRHLLPGVISASASEPAPNTALQRAQDKIEQPMYKQLVYESGGGASGQVQQAAHQEQSSTKRRMTTTSITLPDNFRLPGGSASVHGAVESSPPQPAQLPGAVPLQVRPAPTFQGPTAAQSTSYQQAAAFSAQFTRTPTAPLGQNAIGPQMTSPFMTVQQAAIGPPQLAGSIRPVASPVAIQPMAAPGPVNAQPVAASSLPANSYAPTISQAPVAMHTLQPNAAAAAAIPPAYVSPDAQLQLAAQPGAATTKVSYLSRAESLQWERGQRSFGSQPQQPQAPSQPIVR